MKHQLANHWILEDSDFITKQSYPKPWLKRTKQIKGDIKWQNKLKKHRNAIPLTLVLSVIPIPVAVIQFKEEYKMAKQIKKAPKRNTINLGIISYTYTRGRHSI